MSRKWYVGCVVASNGVSTKSVLATVDATSEEEAIGMILKSAKETSEEGFYFGSPSIIEFTKEDLRGIAASLERDSDG
jgi:hypothetical protein